MRLPWTAGGHRAERGRNVFQTAGKKYFIIRTGAGGDSASGFFCLVRQMCAKRNPQLFIDGWKVPGTTFFIAFSLFLLLYILSLILHVVTLYQTAFEQLMDSVAMMAISLAHYYKELERIPWKKQNLPVLNF